MNYKVIIDTREKKPFRLAGLDTIRQGLRVGDYSIDGFQDRVAIERKGMSDFYSTFGNRTNYNRFIQEMSQINKMEYGYLVVESPLEKCSQANKLVPKLKPGLSNMVLMNFDDFKKRLPNVKIYFAASRWGADSFTGELLKSIIKNLEIK